MTETLLKRLIAHVCACALVLGYVLPATATCRIPLDIGSSSGANVLILLDNSGSMNSAVCSPAYDPSIRWSGNFTYGTTYSISTSGTYTPRSFNRRWPSTPSAQLVTSDQGETGDYDGNYLNWVYFHATMAQRTTIPVVTRIQAAKRVVNSVLSTITGCRFAVEIFNGDNGGTVIAPFGSSIGSMQSQVNSIDANAWTPLAESMVTALNYFATTDGSAPFQSSCDKSFIICVTDGQPTHDTTVPNYIRDTDRNGWYLDNVSSYLYRNDLRNDLDGIQNVATFTIGFAVDAGATTLLQLTADNGGGSYFGVSDAGGLASALEADFNTIAARVAAGSAVSVISSEHRTANQLYRARYESVSWKGYVEAFDLPYHSGAASRWEAGSLLGNREADSRVMFTSTNGTNTVPFTVSNVSMLLTGLGTAATDSATHIIQYTRGAAVTGSRDRQGWKLGDIIDAAPVAIGAPNGFINDYSYPAFRAAHANRNEVVYVGANDGMLHCFSTTDGTEQWTYIPYNQLAKLYELMDPAYCHDYFVNLTPVTFDAYLSGRWRTMLIGGDQQGGTGLFALDVTDPSPDSVRVMWDLVIPTLKGSWSPPSMVHDITTHTQRLAVGTGFDSTMAQANLLVMNPADGSIIRTIALGSPAAGNKTTRGVVIDRDLDGYDDLLYLGDLTGRIWRVDLTVDPWTVRCLFNCGQPIQGTPVATLDSQNRPMIFFGTGRYITSGDPMTTSRQSIYGVIDTGSSTTLTPTDLVDQSTTFTRLGTHPGWFMNLVLASGERVIRTPALVAGTLYVPSFAPSTSCGGGGRSWLYSLDYEDGSAPDTHNGQENDTTDGRSQSMGDGILADPTVDIVNQQLLLQSSNGVLLSEDISAALNRLVSRAWRQRWN